MRYTDKPTLHQPHPLPAALRNDANDANDSCCFGFHSYKPWKRPIIFFHQSCPKYPYNTIRTCWTRIWPWFFYKSTHIWMTEIWISRHRKCYFAKYVLDSRGEWRHACCGIPISLHYFWDYEPTIRRTVTKIHRMAVEECGEYAAIFILGIWHLCE